MRLGQGWQEKLEPSASVSGAVMATTAMLDPSEAGAKSTTTTTESVDILHKRMGHPHPGDMKDLHRNPGTCLKVTGNFSNYASCVER